MEKVVQIDESCTGCGICVQICPLKILKIDENTNKAICIDDAKCDKLAGCEHMCPVKAIHIN